MPNKIGEFIVNLDVEALRRGIKYIAESTVNDIKQAVKDLAHAAHSAIAGQATKTLNQTRKSYLSGLKFETVSPDNYIIYLDGKWPNSIEDGWKPYDMKDSLLSSTALVKEGRNKGREWVQKTKSGPNKDKRYAHVPFEHSTGKAAKGSSNLAEVIKSLEAYNKRTGLKQKITKVFKDESGKSMVGNVATFRYPADFVQQFDKTPLLEGLTKYQSIKVDKNGKERVTSVYLTFRTISDLSAAGKWYSSGYQGLGAFPEAEKEVEKELQNILDHFLK
jgi:hypothetical protein